MRNFARCCAGVLCSGAIWRRIAQRCCGEALTTNQPADSLSFVDLATMKAVAEIKIGGKPAGIALSPDGAKAYVTAPDSKELVEVDARIADGDEASDLGWRAAWNCGTSHTRPKSTLPTGTPIRSSSSIRRRSR